jgi:hypothetical protein
MDGMETLPASRDSSLSGHGGDDSARQRRKRCQPPNWGFDFWRSRRSRKSVVVKNAHRRLNENLQLKGGILNRILARAR